MNNISLVMISMLNVYQIWGLGSCEMGSESTWTHNLWPETSGTAQFNNRHSGRKQIPAVQGVNLGDCISYKDDGVMI